MVARGRFIIVFAALGLFASGPVLAQGILEQMQDEVAAIVSRSRTAIVSIEDERIFGGQRGRPENGGPKRPDGASALHDASQSPQESPRRPMGEPPKAGTGFSIGDGFIVTTADVLSGMKHPMVLTEDGRRIHATVAGIDPEMNIGVLKLTGAASLPALKLGQSSRVYAGHFAISIGNQFGHLNSVALTLVAGVRDDGVPAGEHFYPALIQIAGTVGAGTSGAPILNVRGEVIGMIAGVPFGDWTASPFLNPAPNRGGAPGAFPGGGRPTGVIDAAVGAGSPSPDSTGTAPVTPGQPPKVDPRFVFMRPPFTSAGFALPIDDMKPVLAGIRQNKFVHCWLGVDMKEERKPVERDGAVTWRRTVTVSTVYPNSPASAAGFQVGDALTTVNSRPVTRLNVIRAALLRAQPGDGMEVHLERKDGPHTITARLAARPPESSTSPSPGKH
jgi:S1-C subfamily serine protease